MNKQKFVEYIRSPETISEEEFVEIRQLLVDHPYFSIAKSVAARAAKELGSNSRSKLISSAAIYATDRKHLKRYISGELIFLGEKPQISSDTPPEAQTAKHQNPETTTPPKTTVRNTLPVDPDDLENLKPPSAADVDQILDELEHDMEALRKSRLQFIEIQNQIEQEESSLSEKRENVGSQADETVESSVSSTESEVRAPESKKTDNTDPSDSVEEQQETNDAVEETPDRKGESTTTESVEAKDGDKNESLSDLMIDLEALKKEFAEEEKEEEEEIEKKTQAKLDSHESKSKNEEDRAQQEKAPPSPSPKPPTSSSDPNIVTNMSEAEENDDNEPGYFDEVEPDKPEEKPTPPSPRKKKPARADRDMRMKIKRSELDRMMGMKSIPKPPHLIAKDTDPSDSEETEEKKTAKASQSSTKKSESPKEKPASSRSKKATTAKKTTNRKKLTDEEKKSKNPKPSASTSKPKSSSTAKSRKKEEASDSDEPGNDPATRATRKALLDFGKAEGLSMSVSRASSSKRKRSRTNKSKSEDQKKGSKDDDDSGGIIDRFLKENPGISRKVTSINKTDLSEESSKWQGDIASEYLAEIYLQQGNKKRAIRIYEQLMLKFPEKKSYFAGLIEKLGK